jgi:hypothetical protein
MQKSAMLPRGTTSTTQGYEALVSFGWLAASVDSSPAQEPTDAGVDIPAEAWLVLRVAAARDIGELLSALSVAEEEDPSSESGWNLLRTACEAQLAVLPSQTAIAEPDGGVDGVSAAAASAATEARRKLLKAAAAAARTACKA